MFRSYQTPNWNLQMMFDNDLGNVAPPPLPIMIAKHDKQLRGILRCKDWCGVRTHWYGGHTIACCGTENCPACEANQDWVKKLYIIAQSPATQNCAIFMLTPLAASEIVVHRRKDHGVLGCEVVLGRAAPRNTAPMTARVVNYHPETPEFGRERLERVIMRIFSENAQRGPH